MKRVRFAPSPTGSLHIGNALCAVANRALGDWHARYRVAGAKIGERFDGITLLREERSGDVPPGEPELAAVVAALDREETVRRLDAAL